MKKRFPLKQKVTTLRNMNNIDDLYSDMPKFNIGDRPKECQKLVSLTRNMYDAIETLADRNQVSMQEIIYMVLESYLVRAAKRGAVKLPDSKL